MAGSPHGVPRNGRSGWKSRTSVLALAGVLLGTLAPPGLFGLIWGGAPWIGAEEALNSLVEVGSSAVLVDVRSRDAFERRHVQAAMNWPSSEIETLAADEGVPEPLQGKRLYLICDAGLASANAARDLEGLGIQEVYSVAGGMQAWVGACGQGSESAFCRWGSPATGWEGAPFRPMSLGEQWAAALSAFAVKPLYMLGAAVLIIILRGRTDKDLRLACWSMVAFLGGETCCAANYLLFGGASIFLDYWHGAGMVVAFGLAGLAAMEGLDSRFLHLNDDRRPCASLRMCGACVRNGDAPCAARRGFILVSGLAATLAFIPLLAPLRTDAYNTIILGTPYSYLHPAALQLFETRYCPIVALLLLTGAFASLLAVKNRPTSELARVLFAAGIGALGFGVFRLALGSIFERNLVWASFWEELTELELVAGITALLWIFRERLLARAGA